MATEQQAEPREWTDDDRATIVEELSKSEPLPMVRKSIDAFRRWTMDARYPMNVTEPAAIFRGAWLASFR